MSRSFSITVVLEPQPEGGFTVTVPALPEVITEGDTEADALAMAEEAIGLAIERRQSQGVAIPLDMPPLLRTLCVVADAENNRATVFEPEIAPRHPAIDAALAEALEDERAGRLTPAFSSMEELKAWLLTDAGKRFSNDDPK